METTLPDRSLAGPTAPIGTSSGQRQRSRPDIQCHYVHFEKTSSQSTEGQQPKFPNQELNTNASRHFTGINDLTFLQDAGTGFAQMNVVDSRGKERAIGRLDMEKIKQKCSVLALAFKKQVVHVQIDPVHYLCDMRGEAPSAVIAVLRWIYMDDYTFCEAMIDTQVPLLLHLQVLYLAQKFEASELEILAQMKIEGETADAARMKEPIADLCEAVRYLYTHLRKCEGLRRLIASYIMSNLEAHLMNEQEAFRQTVYQSPLFHRDLIHANFESNFMSPLADAVIKMPVCGHEAHSSTEFLTSVNDFFCEFHTNLWLLHQKPQMVGNDIGTNKGHIKPASLRRKFSFDKDLEISNSDTSPKRPRQQAYQMKPEESIGRYTSSQQNNPRPSPSSFSSGQFRPLQRDAERATVDHSRQYQGLELGAERHKLWDAVLACHARKAGLTPGVLPEGQFADAFAWPDPSEADAGSDSEASEESLGRYNEKSKQKLTLRIPNATCSVKRTSCMNSFSLGGQPTDVLAAGTPTSEFVLDSGQIRASLDERFTSPGQSKPEHRTSMLSEMRRNTQLSGLGEAFEDISISKDASKSKQTETAKPTLATLLDGSSAYSRGPDGGNAIKPEESQPEYDFVKVDISQVSNPVRDEGFEVMDLSSDDDWENVDIPDGKIGK